MKEVGVVMTEKIGKDRFENDDSVLKKLKEKTNKEMQTNITFNNHHC